MHSNENAPLGTGREADGPSQELWVRPTDDGQTVQVDVLP